MIRLRYESTENNISRCSNICEEEVRWDLRKIFFFIENYLILFKMVQRTTKQFWIFGDPTRNFFGLYKVGSIGDGGTITNFWCSFFRKKINFFNGNFFGLWHFLEKLRYMNGGITNEILKMHIIIVFYNLKITKNCKNDVYDNSKNCLFEYRFIQCGI